VGWIGLGRLTVTQVMQASTWAAVPATGTHSAFGPQQASQLIHALCGPGSGCAAVPAVVTNSMLHSSSCYAAMIVYKHL
jgi:hypothetical protein